MDLSEIFSGQITAAKWRQLGEHLAGGTISGGVGMRIRKVGNKTIISARRRKGGGVGGGAALGQLAVTTTRPAFIEAATGEIAEGTLRLWVTYGTINSKIATNITDHFDVTDEKAIYAKVTFTTTGAFAVTSWIIETQAKNWAIPVATGPRPENGYYQLGTTFSIDDKLVLLNNGEGSLQVWPQISNSLTGTTADTSIVWSR